MFRYFSNENLSERNGVSATVSMATWFFLCLLSLLNIIPIVGSIVWLIVYIVLGFKAETAPSIKNYIKLQLILAAIVFVFAIVIIVACGGLLVFSFGGL